MPLFYLLQNIKSFLLRHFFSIFDDFCSVFYKVKRKVLNSSYLEFVIRTKSALKRGMSLEHQ